MKFIKEYTLEDLSICDKFIELFHDAKKADLTYAGRVGGGSVMPEIKKSEDFFIEDGAPLGPPEKYKFDCYKKELDGFIKTYLKDLDVLGHEFIMERLPQIQYYQPGDGFYTWHVDGSGKDGCDRAFVYITYLNDVPDGGTEFYYQDYTVKAEKGKTVIFPAALTHKHRGQISETQEKYIMTGWIWWV
jgi:hypothetical protein|tara:strand:- start:2845 stop:3408 length:564 start_codon:yes stop_codon:yes gene_type:complete